MKIKNLLRVSKETRHLRNTLIIHNVTEYAREKGHKKQITKSEPIGANFRKPIEPEARLILEIRLKFVKVKPVKRNIDGSNSRDKMVIYRRNNYRLQGMQ